MSKRDRSKTKKAPETTTPAADPHGAESAEANTKLADFAKAKTAKEAKAAKAPKEAKEPKLDQSGVRKLPPLPRKASASNKPLVDCGCGCGVKTKSKFAPGHDSRLRGWSIRVARDLVKLEAIPDGEREMVTAHIKQLKKDGKWEDLKNPQVTPKKKAAAAAAE